MRSYRRVLSGDREVPLDLRPVAFAVVFGLTLLIIPGVVAFVALMSPSRW